MRTTFPPERALQVADPGNARLERTSLGLVSGVVGEGRRA
jgi:hypothetical protein